MIKYICRTGWVVSPRDNQRHMIQASRLLALYKVDKKDSWLVHEFEKDFGASEDYWQTKYPNCVFLDPDPTGRYEVPEHGFEVDPCLSSGGKTMLYEWYGEGWEAGQTQMVLADNLEDHGYTDQAVLAELRTGKEVSRACITMFDMVLTRVAVDEVKDRVKVLQDEVIMDCKGTKAESFVIRKMTSLKLLTTGGLRGTFRIPSTLPTVAGRVRVGRVSQSQAGGPLPG